MTSAQARTPPRISGTLQGCMVSARSSTPKGLFCLPSPSPPPNLDGPGPWLFKPETGPMVPGDGATARSYFNGVATSQVMREDGGWVKKPTLSPPLCSTAGFQHNKLGASAGGIGDVCEGGDEYLPPPTLEHHRCCQLHVQFPGSSASSQFNYLEASGGGGGDICEGEGPLLPATAGSQLPNSLSI